MIRAGPLWFGEALRNRRSRSNVWVSIAVVIQSGGSLVWAMPKAGKDNPPSGVRSTWFERMGILSSKGQNAANGYASKMIAVAIRMRCRRYTRLFSDDSRSSTRNNGVYKPTTNPETESEEERKFTAGHGECYST